LKIPNKLNFAPTTSVVLKPSLVQLHRQIGRLEVQRHHLNTSVPENLRQKVAAVHSAALWVDSTQLALVVAGEFFVFQ